MQSISYDTPQLIWDHLLVLQSTKVQVPWLVILNPFEESKNQTPYEEGILLLTLTFNPPLFFPTN